MDEISVKMINYKCKEKHISSKALFMCVQIFLQLLCSLDRRNLSKYQQL
jgi:hypothetical protein